MKTLSGVLFLVTCFVSCTYSFPGVRDRESGDKKSVDTVLVLPSDTRDQLMGGTFDLSDISDESNFEQVELPTFDSWFRQSMFDDWYARINEFMNKLRSRFHNSFPHVTELTSPMNWDKIPEGANTTSTTKIVDGHLVTINETTYTSGGDDYGALIRVRVIDVRPQNETILMTEAESDAEVTTLPTTMTTGRSVGTTTTNQKDRTTPSRSVETVEEFDNEIPKNQVDTLTA